MKSFYRFFYSVCFLVLVLGFASWSVAADLVASAPKLKASSYILQDFYSGQVLVQHNADKRIEPASITKLMTAYVIYHELANGSISEDQSVRISEKAWKAVGSRMFVEVGTSVLVKDLLKGIIIQSGNDASIAMAEFVAGSEEAFVVLMNQYAQRLGMKNTHFVNSTGLPHEAHYTTASDLVRLSYALINDFPDHYALYAEKTFRYNNITQYNRNKLLWQSKYVDGMKTGHTESAGYCLVSSALKDGMRLISIVMGTGSEDSRVQESYKLLTYGFRFYKTYKLYDAGQKLQSSPVWLGDQEEVVMGLTEPLFVTIPRGQYDSLAANSVTFPVIKAPVVDGQVLGNVNVLLNDESIVKRPLVALGPVGSGSIWSRAQDHTSLFFKNFFND